MNDRTKELAKQVGATMHNIYPCYEKELERFAELIRADEREACAKLCESYDKQSWFELTQEDAAEAIRARGEK